MQRDEPFLLHEIDLMFEALGAPGAARSEYGTGYQAYGDSDGLADNRHPFDTRARLDWQNGWSQARDAALRRRRGRETARAGQKLTGLVTRS